MLNPASKECIELTMLNFQKSQYEGIISGKTINEKKAQTGFEKLTHAELYGIVGYTSNLYSTINTSMRNNVDNAGKFTDAHVELAGSITSGLNKLKPYKGRTYRHNGDFPGFADVNVRGATVVEIAPTSTALNQSSCAGAGEQHDVLEIFESINGKDVSAASLFSKESEVMFVPGTRFRVTAVFVRRNDAWNKPHDEQQYKINGQDKQSEFKEAMALVKNDTKKDSFRRIIFKQEIKG